MTANKPEAVTNVDSVETVLKIIRKMFSGRIIIAEGSSIGSTIESFNKHGYQSLVEKYKVELLDLNHDEGTTIEAVDKNSKPLKVQISKTIASAPYIISISPIKTHNSVILSMSIENMVTGSLLKGSGKKKLLNYQQIFRKKFQDYKTQISQNPNSHNLSIAKIYTEVTPNLAILDGFEMMERNGPVGGQMVEAGIAIAGLNAIAVDTIAAYITGFDPGKIGYLHHLNFAKLEIKTMGNKLADCKIKLRPPDSLQEQLKWYKRYSIKRK